MKKNLMLIISVLCLLCACGSNEPDSPSEENSTNQTEVVEEVALDEQMNVEEYSFENTIGDTLCFLAITNNSSKTVKIDVNVIAKDADGNIIGATASDQNAVGSGETVCLCNYFSAVKNAESFEYTMVVEEDAYYESAMKDIEIQESRTDDKVIITCTNIGEEEVDDVEAYALFFMNGELIGYDSSDIDELKAGVTMSTELAWYNGYDDVKVYVRAER